MAGYSCCARSIRASTSLTRSPNASPTIGIPNTSNTVSANCSAGTSSASSWDRKTSAHTIRANQLRGTQVQAAQIGIHAYRILPKSRKLYRIGIAAPQSGKSGESAPDYQVYSSELGQYFVQRSPPSFAALGNGDPGKRFRATCVRRERRHFHHLRAGQRLMLDCLPTFFSGVTSKTEKTPFTHPHHQQSL